MDSSAERLSDSTVLILLSFGIYCAYLVYGFFQELIFATEYAPGQHFNDPLLLVLCQCITNYMVGRASLWYVGQKPVVLTPRDMSSLSVAYIGATCATNYALKFVNYPTQVLVKCGKLISVMLMRIVVNGKKYLLRDYINVFLITGGVVIFSMFKENVVSSTRPASDFWIGVPLLLLALVLDGFTGPFEERLFEACHPHPYQLMAAMNLYAFVTLLTGLLFVGNLTTSLAFLLAHPKITLHIAALCGFAAVGQALIMVCIHRFNSLVVSVVTTVRKFFTILLSVLWFGHSLNAWQWLGIALVFSGLGLNSLYSCRRRRDPTHHTPGDVSDDPAPSQRAKSD